MRFARASLFPLLIALGGCATTLQTIPESWLSVPQATRIRSLTLSAEGKVAPSSQPTQQTLPKGSIRAMADPAGTRIANGDKPLTEPFGALDSFDLSEARGEVVFSVRRGDGFDVGLVAVEGSDISWVPNDPADEVGVQWAPRGSKISYVVRARFGDVVRTLHIPTAFQFGVELPFSRVNALAWDPQAERYAVSYSSPTSSDAVDLLRYSGEQRTVTVKPAAKTNADVQPFTGESILIVPLDLVYNEKVPLVIWRDENVLGWNDARAELMRTARVALVVTSRPPDADMMERANKNPIIDTTRVFTVNGMLGGATTITADRDLPAGRYRRDRNVVSAPPAVIESFAARFIADQLKRNVPPNGSR